ncbi:MAG: hypothetical protein AB7G75_18595 [Candidatus Binatia bacterium]
MGKLFTIGKIIQIRDNPEKVNRLAFVETEEHLRHAHEIVQWLYPNASPGLARAAKEHDVGKKVYLLPDFVRHSGKRDPRLTSEKLRSDFYGEYEGEAFQAEEAIARYLEFVKDPKHVKPSVIRRNSEDDTSPVEQVRYKLDPPFGNHAASVELADLREEPNSDLGYLHTLIQLHHNFQVEKLVAAGAQYGDDIVKDLYRLITTDHEASRWAEYVVQKLEGGEEPPQGKFGFSEFGVEVVEEPQATVRSGIHVQGRVKLRATHRPDLGEWVLIVDYYASGCDVSLSMFEQTRGKRGKKK